MNAIIFDTETNGKIKDWDKKLNANTLDNFPRITQIAWQIVDLQTEEVIKEYQALIKPDGWTIPKEKFFIENNMSTERCEEGGIPIAEAMKEFNDDLITCEIVVAHNMNFDIRVAGAELIRLGVKIEKKLIKVCTMETTISLCKMLPFRYGTYKFPKLVELYKFLFNEEMQGNHDAFDDVTGCRKCFIQLIKLNHLTF